MREVDETAVKVLADSISVKIPEDELTQVTIRLNGMMALLQPLLELPLEDLELIPTLLNQGGSD